MWKHRLGNKSRDWNAAAIDVTKQERTWGSASVYSDYVKDRLPQDSVDYFSVKIRARFGDDMYEIHGTKFFIILKIVLIQCFSAGAWGRPLFFAWGSAGTAGEDKNDAENKNVTGYDLNNVLLSCSGWSENKNVPVDQWHSPCSVWSAD